MQAKFYNHPPKKVDLVLHCKLAQLNPNEPRTKIEQRNFLSGWIEITFTIAK